MRTNLTQEQINTYREDGCLIVREFLPQTELKELIAAITESMAEMGDWKLSTAVGSKNERWKQGNEYYDRVFIQRVNLWKINETVKRFFLAPELGEMLCQLEGIDGVRVWHDQTLQKQPWANPTAWHSDDPKWSFHNPHAISIWIALDDATIQNGCMYYLPGSHKLGNYENLAIREDTGGYFEVFPQFKGVQPIIGEMKAGDAGLHNGLTAHGAGPNMTPGWRRAMTCAYMPDGATFNGIQNILSDEQMAELEVGDLLNDKEQNPLVWSREMVEK